MRDTSETQRRDERKVKDSHPKDFTPNSYFYFYRIALLTKRFWRCIMPKKSWLHTNERMFTLKEAAEKLACHPLTLRRKIQAGEIRAMLLGNAYRIKEKDLESFIRKGQHLCTLNLSDRVRAARKRPFGPQDLPGQETFDRMEE